MHKNFPNLLGPMGWLSCGLPWQLSKMFLVTWRTCILISLCLLWKTMLAFKYLKVVSGLETVMQTKARWSTLLSDREEPTSAIWQRDFQNFIWLTENRRKKTTIQIDNINTNFHFCHICQVGFLAVNKETKNCSIYKYSWKV